MRSVFISYRRNDAEGEAGRLFDDLTLRFSAEAVFMDVAAIEPGRDFRKAIDTSVANCSALLAMIGRDWLDVTDAAGRRRLDDVHDFVRIELVSALRRDIPVVPVLVRGAKMPDVNRLPDDLKELAFRNAVELSHAQWKSDVQILVQALEPHIGQAREYAEAPAEPRTAGQAAEPPLPASARQALPAAQDLEHAASPAPASPDSRIASERLERLSRGLAMYIGPIAEIVVKRTARRAGSFDELCRTLALEIETERDRTKFLNAVRK